MTSYKFELVSSLEKVFPCIEPKCILTEGEVLSGLIGERVSFQLAYKMNYDGIDIKEQGLTLEIDTALNEKIEIRTVELVPSQLPAYGTYDDNYISVQPGLFPDLLLPKKDERIELVPGQWRSIWFTISLHEKLKDALNPISVIVKKEEEIIWSRKIFLEVIQDCLPKQNLIYTSWFHADCVANYYGVEVFSDEHWQIIENYVKSAVKHGVNMLLTPIFTPPLDTGEGGERTTVQLVGIKKEGKNYSFDFENLNRWLELCERVGIEYIEICHLFTQWGAKHAPKILVDENGEVKKMFGWHTDVKESEYADFLKQLIPALKSHLRKKWDYEKIYFHISDEPTENQMKSYKYAKDIVKDLLKDCKVMDAISDFFLYKEGIIENPIPCTDHIQPFLDAGIENLWTYYCCAQICEVSNRFMSMPSARNRIIGVQLYLYNIVGFLHWGFNFYNNRHSISAIDPYKVTDAGGAFPSGDPFLVYPDPNGKVYESIRYEVFSEALFDLRALLLLEKYKGRSFVIDLIHEGIEERITFKKYPKEAEYLLNLRKKINREIKNVSENY